jgi:phage baseplate assembly protein gpV
MSGPDSLERVIAEMMSRLADLERRGRNRRRTGKIVEVDHQTGRYRVQLSEQQGKPFLTPWIAPRQVAAGNVKIDVLLSEGEQVDVVSENGDLTDARIEMSAYSQSHARDGSPAPLLLTIGDKLRLVCSAEGVRLVADTVEIEANLKVTGNADFAGGHLRHNEINVGDDHAHRDVRRGADISGPPVGG